MGKDNDRTLITDEDTPPAEQAGAVLQQLAADKAREAEDKKKKKTAAGFRRASSGGGNNGGFSLAGKDANGSGFSLPVDSLSLFGGKFFFVKPEWHQNKDYAQHFAHKLNPRFDRLIGYAIKHNWVAMAIEQGIAGRVAAHPVLTEALNNRIMQLAAGVAAGDKEANRIIRGMGYQPDKVLEQLQTLKAYAGNVKDVRDSLQAAASRPPGGPPPPS